MDEKRAPPMPPPIRRGLSPFRLALASAYLGFVALLYFGFSPFSAGHWRTPPPPAATRALVPLEAHIMSKCPDARVSCTGLRALLL